MRARKFIFVIPCYNASANLPSLFESLYQQRDQDWHAIFIDDVSKDDTAAYIEKIAVNDDRVVLVKNTEKK
jgi:glycosyltransferase involved in cell wall biosynthesis